MTNKDSRPSMFAWMDLKDEDYDIEDMAFDNSSEVSFLDRVLSHAPNYVRPMDEVVNPLPLLGDISAKVTEILPSVPFREVFTEEDIPCESLPRLSEIATSFNKVLSYPFEVSPVIEKQSAISKAVVAPEVGFIVHELSTQKDKTLDVLIVGAGTGKDIGRLEKGDVKCRITCIEPDGAACEKLRLLEGVEVYQGTFNSVWHDLSDQSFDVVIANMSVHYVLGVSSAPSFVRFLDTNLRKGGKFYGSFFDVPTIKAISMHKVVQYGHSLMYMGDDPKTRLYGERVTRSLAKISVAGRIFSDPVVEVSDVYELFEQSGNLDFNVYSGNDIVYGASNRGPIYHLPPHFDPVLSRPELGALRCIIASKPYVKDASSFSYKPTSHVVQSDDLDGAIIASSTVEYNKGFPACARDLAYIEANSSWIGIKHDGVMGRLHHRCGKIRIITEDGQTFRFGRTFQSKCPASFVLQVEIVGDEKKKCIVTDVLLPPWGQTGSFRSRWRWLEHTVKTYALPFDLQHWVESSDHVAVLEMIMHAEEGVVLQSAEAPPGFIRGGAGSARYVKKQYTIDKRVNGKIVEETLDGNYVRDRPDKRVPNTPTQVEMILNAVPWRQFIAYFYVRTVGVVGGDWRKLRYLLKHSTPPQEWEDADLLLFYTNRNETALRHMLNGVSTEFAYAVVREICLRADVVHKEKEDVRSRSMFDDLLRTMDEEENGMDIVPSRTDEPYYIPFAEGQDPDGDIVACPAGEWDKRNFEAFLNRWNTIVRSGEYEDKVEYFKGYIPCSKTNRNRREQRAVAIEVCEDRDEEDRQDEQE